MINSSADPYIEMKHSKKKKKKDKSVQSHQKLVVMCLQK